jgi:multiple sugar transport system permease protein
MTTRLRLRLSNSTFYFLIVLVGLIGLIPLYFIGLTSLKPDLLLFTRPPVFFFPPTLDGYVKVLKRSDFILAYRNTIIVGLLTTVFSLYLGTTCGYALARAKFRGSQMISVWILLIRMAPPIGFALPLYVMLRTLRLLDTFPGLVLVYLTRTLPFVTWLMIGFVKAVPEALEESASIDGCTRIQTLFRITLPLTLPGITTCAIFTFIMSWNEFFYALIIAGRRTVTAPLVIRGFISAEAVNWAQLAAASILVVIPVVIFGMIVQKGLVAGLAKGAIK